MYAAAHSLGMVISWFPLGCRLFSKYDKDGSGMLEGREYNALLDDVTDYMVEDFRKQGCGVGDVV
jgi:hypothetical protein